MTVKRCTPALGAEVAGIMRVSNILENGKHIGNPDAVVFWHSDGTYQERPAMYSLLYAIEVPVKNDGTVGDTYYASTAAAYDARPVTSGQSGILS